MASRSGYVLISSFIHQNLQKECLNYNEEETGIQIKLGFGTPDERLNTINRANAIKFVKLFDNTIQTQKDETKFRHCFQNKFSLQSRDNSNEEFFVSIKQMVEINEKHNFEIQRNMQDYDFCKKCCEKMIEKVKELYVLEEQNNLRKRQRDEDVKLTNNEKWERNCRHYKEFIDNFNRKPQTRQSQKKTNRDYINEYEGYLSSWYSGVKYNKRKLNSIRSFDFAELEDYIEEKFAKK